MTGGGEPTGEIEATAASAPTASTRRLPATFPCSAATAAAPPSSADVSCDGAAEGAAAASSASVPATNGAAIDVPLIVAYPPPGAHDTMLTPGAAIPTPAGPKFENEARVSDCEDAATATTPAYDAG